MSDGARLRDAAARRRDRAADARDRDAERRDALARLRGGATLDETLDRAAAAADRRAAARDRAAAALDRRAGLEELAAEGVDRLTGTLRRTVGLAAMQRELDRAMRDDTPLVVAFIDVDGLKDVNDQRGHAAGDFVLREVARAVARRLRSYDVVTRIGGDEFVCSLAGDEPDRFDGLSEELRDRLGTGVTVGIATRQPGDTLEGLIDRADAALLGRRRERRTPRRAPAR